MKRVYGLSGLATVLLMVTISARAQGPKTGIESLSWLSGCWEQNDEAKKRFGSEQWMRPAGLTMIGMSRTVRNGKTVGFEYLRIVESDTGISYISKPSQNQEETAFKLVKNAPNEAVFENPAHDFPQRIIYRLEKGSLFARIEGVNNGKSMGVDFPMTRAKCD